MSNNKNNKLVKPLRGWGLVFKDTNALIRAFFDSRKDAREYCWDGEKRVVKVELRVVEES